jgi:regulator of sigma E protease
MAALRFIGVLLEVLILFNSIILVHELGHFLAARWRGMVVDRFSIWFGKPLFQKKVGHVVFSLGTIPFGGFVSLPQMAPMEFLEGRVLQNGEPMRPVGAVDKIIVSVAGPAFSLGLAFVFATIVWWVGTPTSEAESTTVIGYVEKNSAAAQGGLQPGDKIVSVDGHPVDRFTGAGNSVAMRIAFGEEKTVHIEYERDGVRKAVDLLPVKDPVKGWQRENIRRLPIEPAEKAVVGKVISPSPAERAGLRPQDIVHTINGRTIFHPQNVVEILQTNGVLPLQLDVERDGQRLQLSATPEIPLKGSDARQPRLGIAWSPYSIITMSHPLPWDQVGGVLESMYSTLRALVSPKSEIKTQQISGPVGILGTYFTLFQSEHAIRLVLWFSVLLNVNLAVMNLLPIPMLDGGHIVLSLAELIRRRPLSEPIIRWVQTCGAVVVIGFILYVTSFDVRDLRGRAVKPGKSSPEELIFSPGTEAPASVTPPAPGTPKTP